VSFRIEPTGLADLGPCRCCGSMTRRVWGSISDDNGTRAVYLVEWTIGRPDHGATFDLLLGKWGDGTTAQDRRAVSLLFKRAENGPEFMVVDAKSRPAAESELVGSALMRSDVMGTPLADHVFALVDAIWLQEDRIGELGS
jgi:hypothetical protein